MTAPTAQIRFDFTATDNAVLQAIGQIERRLRELLGTQQTVDRSTKALDSSYASLGKSLGALASVFAVVRFAAFIKGAEDSADELLHLSEKTGVAVETLSALRYVAKQVDVDTTDLNNGFKFLSKSLVQLQLGNHQVAESFGALGLSAKDFQGLGLAESYEKIAKAQAQFIGPNREAALVGIFGRGGQNQIPVLNRVAGQGLAGATAQAAEFGGVISTDEAEKAHEFEVSLAALDTAASALGRNLGASVIPGLTEMATALAKVTAAVPKEAAAAVLGLLGAIAGVTLAGGILRLVGAFAALNPYLGTIAALTALILSLRAAERAHESAATDAETATFGAGLKTASDLVLQAERARLALEVSEAQAKVSGTQYSGYDLHRLEVLRAELALVDQIRAQRAATAAPKGDAKVVDIALELALAQERIAAAKRAIEIEKATLAQEQQAEKSRYEAGLTDLKSYLGQRLAALDHDRSERLRLIDLEIQGERVKRAAETEPSRKAEIDTRIRDLQASKRVVGIESETAKQAAVTEMEQKRLELQKQIAETERRVLAARGETAAGTIALIQAEVDAYARELGQIGTLSEEEKTTRINAFRDVLSAQAQMVEAERTAGATEGRTQAAIAGLDVGGIKGQFGNLGPLADDAKEKAAIYQQAIADLSVSLERERAAAQSPEDEQKIQALTLRLREMQFALREVTDGSVFLFQQLGQPVGAFEAFLTSGLETARTVGDAFRSLALDVVNSLNRIAARLLIARVEQAIYASLFPASSGLGSLATSSVTVAGGSPEVAIAQGFFGALLPGHAEGGLVSGPGTGTSDSVPIMASHGEFVMRASAVQSLGVHTLAALNRGFGTPGGRSFGVPRFAAGGLVTGAGPVTRGGGPHRVTLHLGKGLVAQEIRSDEGGEAALSVIESNPRDLVREFST